MNEELVENPLELVEELIFAKIGDRGRLEYLRDALKRGKRIYNSDRIFLKKMKLILEKRHPELQYPERIPETENPSIEVIKNPSHDSRRQIERAIGKSGTMLQLEHQKYELSSLVKSLHSLKETEIDMVGRLGAVVDALEARYEKQREGQTEIDQYVEQPKALSDSKKKGYTDILVWAAAGSFVVWGASLFSIIDIGEVANVLLGVSVGLVTGAGISYRIQKS